MATAKFGSAGVTAREIDLSSPLTIEPSGIPAGVIGTANKGPAFVPVTVGIDTDFYSKFGKTDGKKFGPLAAVEWLRNAGSLTYMRVLGIGDGKRRVADGTLAGSVTSAGFVVGEDQPHESTGHLLANPNANTGGPPGRTYFLGCFMSESEGSTVFSSAGMQGLGGITPNVSSALPIVRGILMAASGVVLRLSSSFASSSAPTSSLVGTANGGEGSMLGDVVLKDGTKSKQEFVLILNGHKGTDSSYPNVLTSSFDITSPNYFSNVFNKDPYKLQSAGYCLYTHFDIHPVAAKLTGSGLISASLGADAVSPAKIGVEPSAFLLSGAADRNTGTDLIPNYENFEDRFSAARTPWVVSQKFGGAAANLFRLVSLDDGEAMAAQIKFSIENIAKSDDPANKYGTFDLVIRDLTDRDDEMVPREAFHGVTLDASSDRYIAKVIGDIHSYFEFDKVESSQKLVIEGNYPNRSNLVRVEIDSVVENSEIDSTALPMGFRGPAHLVTSGSAPLAITSPAQLIAADTLKRVIEVPLPMRSDITVGSGNKKAAYSAYYWGVQFEHTTNLLTPNSSIIPNRTVKGFTKFLPSFMTNTQNVVASDNEGTGDTDANGIMDADRFNRNAFSLENIQVVTNSSGLADSAKWVSALYVRNGNITADDAAKTRAFSVSDLTQPNRKYLKYSFIMQGGFDGTNIFNRDEMEINNVAITADMDDTARGLNKGPSVKSFSKAVDLMKNTTDADIQLLAIPGIRHSVITDVAALAVKERFDALYLMDIEEYDSTNTLITSSVQVSHVGNTVASFVSRASDNSFAAAYYPDVVVTDPNTNTNVIVPPSVVVLGAFALNDRIGYPWFAPAGFTRGALRSALEAQVKLYKENMDSLYEADINPIVSFPGQAPVGGQTGGLVIWGQKTLQAAATSLDRVNVRRLLIALRREVRDVSNTIIFEPNRESTLARFEAAVRPRLERIQAQKGIDSFLVRIDTSTTSQLDVENNTIKGKIYVLPTKTVEFVSIDFVVTNRGQNGL